MPFKRYADGPSVLRNDSTTNNWKDLLLFYPHMGLGQKLAGPSCSPRNHWQNNLSYLKTKVCRLVSVVRRNGEFVENLRWNKWGGRSVPITRRNKDENWAMGIRRYVGNQLIVTQQWVKRWGIHSFELWSLDSNFEVQKFHLIQQTIGSLWKFWNFFLVNDKTLAAQTNFLDILWNDLPQNS